MPYRRRVPLKPILTARDEDGESIPALVWRLPAPMRAISSAPLGGGIGIRHWVINATVPMSYSRNDPNVHLEDLAANFRLENDGIGHLTGVDVAGNVHTTAESADVWATVGLGQPIWAATRHQPPVPAQHRPGTINIVAFVPARLSDAALVNAVATITEAKAQALGDLGIPGTGTATDAVTVICPEDSRTAEEYGGPLSTWGSRLARATHEAVTTGGRLPQIPWSER